MKGFSVSVVLKNQYTRTLERFGILLDDNRRMDAASYVIQQDTIRSQFAEAVH